jgi:hypothetical protein
MASQDLASKITPAVAFAIQAISSDTTTNGVGIDMSDAESVAFVFTAGAVTDGDYTPQLEESADNSNWSAVADSDIIGTEANAALDTANTVSYLGYVGNKEFVRTAIVSANTTTGATVGAVAVQGDLRYSGTPS